MLTALLLFALTRPLDGATVALCDATELNYVYDAETGDLKYAQMIFWDWSPDLRSDIVAGWVLVNPNAQSVTRYGNRYVYRWTERNSAGVAFIREVRSRRYSESHTKYDRERANKEIMPEKYRRQLFPANTCDDELGPK